MCCGYSKERSQHKQTREQATNVVTDRKRVKETWLILCQKASSLQCTVKPIISRHSKRRPKIGFQIPRTCFKPPFVIKLFVLSIFEWPLKTGLTVNALSLFLPVTTFVDCSSRLLMFFGSLY